MTERGSTPPPSTNLSRPGLPVRIAIVLVATVAIWGTVFALGDAWGDVGATPEPRALNAAIVCTGAVVLVVLVRRHVDRRPWAGLGLPLSRRAWLWLAVGVAAFLLPAMAGMTVGVLTGALEVVPGVGAADIAARSVILIVSVFVLEALPEELIFRGYIFRNLAAAMAPILAVLLQAVMFTACGVALWVAGEGWGVFGERVALFFSMGVVLGMIRVVGGNLWTCIGFHWAFQVLAQILAGGTVTVDGAVTVYVMVPAFVLGTALVSLALRRRANWSAIEPDPPAVAVRA